MSQAPSTASTNCGKSVCFSLPSSCVDWWSACWECEAGDSLGLGSEIMTKLYGLWSRPQEGSWGERQLCNFSPRLTFILNIVIYKTLGSSCGKELEIKGFLKAGEWLGAGAVGSTWIRIPITSRNSRPRVTLTLQCLSFLISKKRIPPL